MPNEPNSGEKKSILSSFKHKPSHLATISSILGIASTLLALPMQHPLDVIRVNMQTNPHLKNEIEVAQMIKREKGTKGFYYGFNTNCAKMVTKSIYRFPLMSVLPRFYSRILNLDYEKNIHKLRLYTSTSIALFEAGIITPFERVQVFMMTAKSQTHNYKDFFDMSKSKFRHELFKGFTPYFTKQLFALTTFLQVDAFYKQLIRKAFSIQDDQRITGFKMMLCSFMICLTTTACVMPFDNVKTYLQKYNLEVVGDKRVEDTKEKMNIPRAFQKIYSTKGILGFFVGWRMKLAVYFVNKSFTIFFLEYIDDFAKKSFQ